MLDSLRAYYVFAHVAETHSFSRAAEQLGVTKSAVSKHIAQLEAELSVQLIVRTTRKLVLTEAGERVYAHAALIAGSIEAAREAARAEGSQVAGKLRVTAPQGLGRHYLIPAVMDFMAQHPELTVDLIFDDHFVDLVEDRIDLALRVGGTTDQSFVSRRLAPVEFFLVAAPSYLARRGTPRSPAELSAHEWLVHSPSRAPGRLTLRRGTRAVTVRTQGRLACNSGPASLAAAVAGQGLLVVPDFEAGHEVHEQRLVRLLPKWTIEQRFLDMVFPPRRHVLRRVRTFADFLGERFRDPPWRCS